MYYIVVYDVQYNCSNIIILWKQMLEVQNDSHLKKILDVLMQYFKVTWSNCKWSNSFLKMDVCDDLNQFLF